jgi:hypothetical protein
LFVIILSKTASRSSGLQSSGTFFEGFYKMCSFTAFENPLKELTTLMTTAFPGRLQFAGKKPGFTLLNGYFRWFTLG